MKRTAPYLSALSLVVLPLLPPVNAHADGPNVILLTMDGVRWEEVFHGPDLGQTVDGDQLLFPNLNGTLAREGFLVGDVRRGESVTVSNKAQNSLPGYQSIFAGVPQNCFSNACGRIKVETFPERIKMDLKLRPEEVAVFSSWERIVDAVEHVPGTIFTNSGAVPLTTDDSEETTATNLAQTKDTPPWPRARWDKHTFAHSLHYLKANRPRFLYISLNDTDEWGHKNNYPNYMATMKQEDAWIKKIVDTLAEMGDYGKQTTLIITTDHGRGVDNEWIEHGSGYVNSKNVWIYGRGPHTLHAANTGHAPQITERTRPYSHSDIRPTIEALFGLEPKLDGVRALPGRVITAIAGALGPRSAQR